MRLLVNWPLRSTASHDTRSLAIGDGVLTAELSRSDAYFGNHYVFNQTVFDRSREYWTAPIVTTDMLANTKLARQIESRAFNPTYTYPNKTNEASLLELAAPIAAFGDPDTGTLRRDFLEYFFG